MFYFVMLFYIIFKAKYKYEYMNKQLGQSKLTPDSFFHHRKLEKTNLCS